MRKNILFNTTRQWNVGDQIIMLGILRILKHLDFNIFIYNRHPAVWGRGVDNSYHPGKHSLKNIDYYITAGTPEWSDEKLIPLFDEIIAGKIPHSFIGIGSSGHDHLRSLPSLSTLLDTSDVLTARDKEAYSIIAPLGGVLLPCPGFLCGEPPTKPRTTAKTIGLIFMACETNPTSISKRLQTELIAGYKTIITKHNTIIICHYIDEALEARNHFPNTTILYSYDARDYENFYARCDLVIGPRLHGVLLATGLGIPSYITRAYSHSGETRRLGAADPLDIPSLIPSPPIAFLEAIKNMNIRKESKRLISRRYEAQAEYTELLCSRMASLHNSASLRNKARDSVRFLLKTRRTINDTF